MNHAYKDEAASSDEEEGEDYAPTKPFSRARIYQPENGHQNHYPNTQSSRLLQEDPKSQVKEDPIWRANPYSYGP